MCARSCLFARLSAEIAQLKMHVFFEVKKELDSHDFGLFFLPMPKLMVVFHKFNNLPVREFNGNFPSKKRGCK